MPSRAILMSLMMVLVVLVCQGCRKEARWAHHYEACCNAYQTGDLTKAEGECRSAVTIATELKEDSLLAISTSTLAALRRTRGDYRDAEGLYLQAIALWNKTPDRRSSRAWQYHTQRILADLLEREGDYNKALTLLLDLQRTHPFLESDLWFQLRIARNYRALGMVEKADTTCMLAIEEFEYAHGAEHPVLGEFLVARAAVLCDQGRYAEAESLYTRALTNMRRLKGIETAEAVDAVDRYAELLMRTDPRRAEALKGSAEAIRARQASHFAGE